MIDTENTEIILQAGRADDSTAADVQRCLKMLYSAHPGEQALDLAVEGLSGGAVGVGRRREEAVVLGQVERPQEPPDPSDLASGQDVVEHGVPTGAEDRCRLCGRHRWPPIVTGVGPARVTPPSGRGAS